MGDSFVVRVWVEVTEDITKKRIFEGYLEGKRGVGGKLSIVFPKHIMKDNTSYNISVKHASPYWTSDGGIHG